MIDKKETQHIAELARLGLTEKEISKMQKELSSILDYIEMLKGVSADGAESTSFSTLIENTMREDQAEKKSSPELMEAVPEKEGKFVKVKTVF